MNAPAQRLARIEMVCGDPAALAEFYRAAFGFVGSDGVLVTHDAELRLGAQTIRLIRALPGGRPCPVDVPGWSPLFQHIAIVVGDMKQAYTHLASIPGWSPISLKVCPSASNPTALHSRKR